jgi:hypothetical protein
MTTVVARQQALDFDWLMARALRWPEDDLRDGSNVYYSHPIDKCDLATLRAILTRLRAAGGDVVLERCRENVPGYPTRYLSVRVVWAEEDL